MAETTTPHRPTAEEEQEREDYAYELLSLCYHKSQIKKKFRARYEKADAKAGRPAIALSARTIERYLSRARARMVIEAAKAKDALRAESLSFYLTVLRDGEASARDKILARERIDKLFGLDTPQKVALTDPSGEKEYAGLTDDERIERLAAILERARNRRDGRAPEGASAEGRARIYPL